MDEQTQTPPDLPLAPPPDQPLGSLLAAMVETLRGDHDSDLVHARIHGQSYVAVRNADGSIHTECRGQ